MLTIRTNVTTLLVALALTVGATLGIQSLVHQRQQADVVAALAADNRQQKAVNDSTTARLAITLADKAALANELAYAHKVHGTLVAALRLKISKRDTLVVHDTLYTQVAVDGTRTATFRDSTFAGTLEGTVTAPPSPAPLGLTYALTRPAFSPSLGFIEVGAQLVAVVTWQGERVEIVSPYQRPPKKSFPMFGGFVEGNYALPSDSAVGRWYGRGGLRMTVPWHVSGQAGIDTRGDVFLGFRKDF
jgi:hypothetical protein